LARGPFYRVFLMNFGWFLPEDHVLFADALAHARRSGFEAIVYEQETPVATWSPLYGTRYLDPRLSQ
jgi:hypothetical protein